jgi:hypothetical protein
LQADRTETPNPTPNTTTNNNAGAGAAAGAEAGEWVEIAGGGDGDSRARAASVADPTNVQQRQRRLTPSLLDLNREKLLERNSMVEVIQSVKRMSEKALNNHNYEVLTVGLESLKFVAETSLGMCFCPCYTCRILDGIVF